MFQIKICGVRDQDTVRAVTQAGGDAIGLNFVPSSTRYVSPEIAVHLVREAAGGLACVGVFVNESIRLVRQLAAVTPLTFVQLHGDESEETLAAFPGETVIRSWRFRDGNLNGLVNSQQSLRSQGWQPAALLLDSYAPGQHGGTGHALPWGRIPLDQGCLAGVPVILAGGLTPENVAEAIRTVRPTGVDVASGVESSPGKKDPIRIRDFVQAARAAFEEMHR